MKKRLLSAALALAMVLTLLPVSVFAADTIANAGSPESGKTSVQYIGVKDNTKKDISGNGVGPGWAWQYTTGGKTYWTSVPSLSGVVVGTGASGVWYDSGSINKIDTNNLVNNSLTLTGKISITDVGNATTLSLNLFGHDLTLSASLEKVNSLTVTNTFATTYGGKTSSISGISRDVSNYTTGTNTVSATGLTLRITGANVSGGINLKGRSNQVYLTGVEVSGGIILDGTTTVTTGTNRVVSWDRQTLDIKSQAASNGVAFIPPAVTDEIDVTGDNSSVSLSDVTGGAPLTVNSTGGTVKVEGASVLGAVDVGCSPNATANQAPASLTISGGTVGSTAKVGAITRTDSNNGDGSANNSKTPGSITVNVNGAADRISAKYANVTVASGKTGTVNIENGSLTISGTSASVGNVTLGDNNGTTTLTVTGTGHQVGNIENKGTLTIGRNWPTGRTNTFGELKLNTGTDYKGQGINGGIFKFAANTNDAALWFNPDLQFMRQFTKDSNTYYAYYGRRELSDAIANAGSDAKNQVITVIGSSAAKWVEFYNSTLDATARINAIAKLGYGATTAIYLPDKINGTPVATWTNLDEAKTYTVNETVSLSTNAGDIKLVLQSSGAVVSKLLNAHIKNAVPSNENANVTVTLSGNQVILSGAVSQTSFADIEVEFTTDLIDNNGKPVTFTVSVAYDTTNKTATFNSLGFTVPTGVTVNNNNIVVGSNTYTLSTSGLAKPASNLTIDYNSTEIVVTVSGNATPAAKQAIIDALSGASTSFVWKSSPAVRQALNAAMATITNNNQVDNWATTAQRAAWNLANRGTLPDAVTLATETGFREVVLVPYLAVTVTAYNDNGTMTATMVPSYRVEVRSNVAAPVNYKEIFKNRTNGTVSGSYLAQAGRSLGTLVSDLTGGGTETGVELQFNLPGDFNYDYVQQDDTYVYRLSNSKPQKMTITRAGRNNTGLGTLVFNKIAPLMELATTDANGVPETKYYNSLQAAVDDAKDGNTLTIYSAYTGSGVINVTGVARKFTIKTLGNTTITPANNNFTVDVDATGHQYTVQLQKNVTPTGGNITVTDVTGGTASVNVNPATVGQTVTITLRPNTGYTSNGVTVRTVATTGVASVVVPVSGSGNSYTFTMPSGSVTVTPAFRQNQTQANATVTVSSPSTGSAVTSALNNQVTPGSVVTVTTYPGAGQRTMGLSISTNGGSATAVRTGVNTFQFTVPTNATSVVVTPTFDVNNNTVFSDVWSKEYYSNPVAWAVSSGITDGTSTYTFSPSNYCTRAQMVTFLWRAAGRPSVANIRNPFVDVSPTLTPGDYYSAILWAVSKGITDGVDSTHFGPSQQVTRAQAVTFLYRFENKPAAGSNSGFYDVPSSQWYAKAVSWAANRSVPITTGVTPTTFVPGRAVTRAEAVTFLYRDRTNKLA